MPDCTCGHDGLSREWHADTCGTSPGDRCPNGCDLAEYGTRCPSCRPGDRDQQQAAKIASWVDWAAPGDDRDGLVLRIAAALSAARAEEAARWRAKIEALADEWEREAAEDNFPVSEVLVYCADRIRAAVAALDPKEQDHE